MSLRLAPRLLATLAPAVLLLPTAVRAQELVTEDAVADVVTVGPTEEGEGDLANLGPTPDNLTVDVVRTVVDHGVRRLRVRVDLRELGRDRHYFAVLATATNAEGAEEVVVLADDAHRTGQIHDRIALGPQVRRG